MSSGQGSRPVSNTRRVMPIDQTSQPFRSKTFSVQVSGAMQTLVPLLLFDWESSVERPKSVSLRISSAESKRFSGLISRWAIPTLLWRQSSANSKDFMCTFTYFSFRVLGSVDKVKGKLSFCDGRLILPLAQYSMMRQTLLYSSSSMISISFTIFGWEIFFRMAISLRITWSALLLGSLENIFFLSLCSSRILTAYVQPVRVSSQSLTSAKAPLPMSYLMRYWLIFMSPLEEREIDWRVFYRTCKANWSLWVSQSDDLRSSSWRGDGQSKAWLL